MDLGSRTADILDVGWTILLQVFISHRKTTLSPIFILNSSLTSSLEVVRADMGIILGGGSRWCWLGYLLRELEQLQREGDNKREGFAMHCAVWMLCPSIGASLRHTACTLITLAYSRSIHLTRTTLSRLIPSNFLQTVIKLKQDDSTKIPKAILVVKHYFFPPLQSVLGRKLTHCVSYCTV